ncbi:MAG: preprotein translocase subunit Sec61beta, partial [Candidatus Norongarragalinales archaeon]
MPSSSTGLMRFYDVSASKIQLGPKLVVGACVAFILLEIFLGLL